MNITDPLSAGISGIFQLGGQALSYKNQKKLLKQQNQYNIDMWKMQADYNSPQAQMQRFQDAGLNPNLIYGQGTNGNMSSAPVQQVPDAPDYGSSMSKLGQLFNIEGLKTVIARRKEAQADAKNAQVNADRNKSEYVADVVLGSDFVFDSKTGQYKFVGTNGNLNNRNTSQYGASNFYLQNRLANSFYKGYLLPYRSAFLQPQIQMLQYEQRFKPYSFWIGQGTRVLNSLPLPSFKFNHNSGGPLNSTYRTEYRYSPQTNYINNHSPF